MVLRGSKQKIQYPWPTFFWVSPNTEFWLNFFINFNPINFILPEEKETIRRKKVFLSYGWFWSESFAKFVNKTNWALKHVLQRKDNQK